jgi:histidine ammonia-lyase
VAEAHHRIRAVVAPLLLDREMGADISAALTLVRDGALADLVDAPDMGGSGVG